MTTTWDPRANEVFLKALELRTAGERQEYLDSACAGDVTLRAEVESLLEASTRAGSFLETPAIGLPSPTVQEEPGVRQITTCAEHPGSVIGSYRLLQKLGEGGMGTVFLAEQTHPVKRKVALKVLKPGMDHPERFRAEAAAVARLEHPNIVQLYEVLENNGRPCLALEYVAGTTLQERLKEKPLTVEEAARLVETLARAIHYAHQQGIIHRDLKPANVLLPWIARTLDDGETSVGLLAPKIADFGMAKLLDADHGQTPSGAILGTPSYMAPEQARGTSKRSGAAADVYSLGAILYELLVGEPPFRGETMVDTLVQAISQKPVSPRRRESEIPAELERICLKCLQKDPADRYASAESLAEDLRHFLTNRPVPDEPPSVADPERGPLRSGGLRRQLLMAGGIAALLLVGLILLFRAVSQPRPPVRQVSPVVVNPQAQLSGRKSQKAPALRDGKKQPPALGKEPQKKNAPQTAGRKSEATPGGTFAALFAQPDLLISMPAPPANGWLAVQASPQIFAQHALGNGTVVLVLDCSGSMHTKQPDARTRLDLARQALKHVLAQVPAGTKVSVWVFSHRFDVNNPNRRFDQVGGADPENYIQRLYLARRWDRKMLAELGPRLDMLQPYNETPIVRAMMEACQDFQGASGPKTLVVLTDGMDNRFQRDNKYNPNGRWTIPAFLVNAFGNKDIAIRIIGFQLPKKEEAIARSQFEEPLKKLRSKGKYYRADDILRLSAALKKSLPQRLCFSLQDSNGQPVKEFETAVEITRRGNDCIWAAVSPGLYRIVIHARNELHQTVRIGPGDRLRLNLVEKGADFVLEPDRVEMAFPGRILHWAEVDGWRFTMLQNQKIVAERPWLQVMVTAEDVRKREPPGEITLGHVKAGLILFQVHSQEDPKHPRSRLHCYAVSGMTAPAWGLNVKPWDPRKKPVLEAFWSQEPLERYSAAVLHRDRHFDKDLQVLPEGKSIKVQLSKNKHGNVRLLSLKVEKHIVDAYDGQWLKRQERFCVVVRLRFPPGNPVMAQLPNFTGGQKHLFYSETGGYTGLFWDMNPQRLQQELQSLHLVSLAGFREQALASDNHVRIDLGMPDHLPRPAPPQ